MLALVKVAKIVVSPESGPLGFLKSNNTRKPLPSKATIRGAAAAGSYDGTGAGAENAVGAGAGAGAENNDDSMSWAGATGADGAPKPKPSSSDWEAQAGSTEGTVNELNSRLVKVTFTTTSQRHCSSMFNAAGNDSDRDYVQ